MGSSRTEIIEPNSHIEIACPNTTMDQTFATLAPKQFISLGNHESIQVGMQVNTHISLRLLKSPMANIEVEKTTNKDNLVDKYFLVFDLNGTLLKHVKEHVCTKMKNQYCMRPKLREFLMFCLNNFEVAFWTCSFRKDALKIIDAVKKECDLPMLSDCKLFSREDCEVSNYKDFGIPKREILFKALDSIFKEDKLGSEATSSNTLLIDNSPIKNLLNDPFNVIHPEKFQIAIETSDESLAYLTTVLQPYLQKLKNSGGISIPTFCEQFHFGNDRWDRTHPKMNLYLELEKNSMAIESSTQMLTNSLISN